MKIVRVIWIDSAAYNGWHPMKEHMGPPPKCETVGYLLEKTDAYVTLVQSVSAHGNGDNSLTIPCSVIKQIRRLKD